MRYNQKKRLLEALETMKEGHSFIEEQCEQSKKETVYGMLSYLQEMAVKVGETVEREESYPQRIIEELECYCEQLYECSEQLENSRAAIERNEIMGQQLVSIEELIKEIDAKIKIAFFPINIRCGIR